MTAPLLIAIGVLAQTSTLSVSYNDVRGTTSENLDMNGVHHIARNGLRIDLQFSIDSVGKDRPAYDAKGEVSLMLYSRSTTWEFLKYNDAIIQYDDVRLSLKPTSESRDVHDGYVTEIFHYRITPEALQVIGNSEVVNFAIGGTKFSLQTTEKADLREYCRRLLMTSGDVRDEVHKQEVDRQARLAEQAEKDRVRAQKAEAEAKARKEEEENKAKVKADETAAVKDIGMAKQFLKIGRKDTAKEYLGKALGRSPSESVRKDAETLLKSLAK